MEKILFFFTLFFFIFVKISGDEDEDWCVTQSCDDNNCDVDESCIHCCGVDDLDLNYKCLDVGKKCPKLKWWEIVCIILGAMSGFFCCFGWCYCWIHVCCIRNYIPKAVEPNEELLRTILISPIIAFVFVVILIVPLIGSFVVLFMGITNLNNCDLYPYIPWYSIGYSTYSLAALIHWYILLYYLRKEYVQKYSAFNKKFWKNWKNILGKRAWMGYIHIPIFCMFAILSAPGFSFGFRVFEDKNDDETKICNTTLLVSLIILSFDNLFLLCLPALWYLVWSIPTSPFYNEYLPSIKCVKSKASSTIAFEDVRYCSNEQTNNWTT